MSPFRLPSDLIGIGPGVGPGMANTPPRPPTPPPRDYNVGGKVRMPEEGEEDTDLSSLMNYYRPQAYIPPAYVPNTGGMPSAPTFGFPVTIPRGSPGGPVGVGMPEPSDRWAFGPGVNPATIYGRALFNRPEPEPEEEAPEPAMPMYRPGYVPPRPMNSNAFFSF